MFGVHALIRCVLGGTGLSCGPGKYVEEYSVSVCGVEATLYVAPGAPGYIVESETPADERVVCNADLVGEWVWGSVRYTRWENSHAVAGVACIRAPIRLERATHVIGCIGAGLEEYEEKYFEAAALLGRESLYNTYIILEGLDDALIHGGLKPYRIAPLTGPSMFSQALAYSPLVINGVHAHASAHVLAAELTRLIEGGASAAPPWLAKRFLAEPGLLRRVLDTTLISRVEPMDGSLRIRAPAGSIVGVRVGEKLVAYIRVGSGDEVLAVPALSVLDGITYIVYPLDTIIHTEPGSPS